MGWQERKDLKRAGDIYFKAKRQGLSGACYPVALAVLGGKIDFHDIIRYHEGDKWIQERMLHESGLNGIKIFQRGAIFNEEQLASFTMGPRNVNGLRIRGYTITIGNEEIAHQLAVMRREDLPRDIRRRMRKIRATLAILDINTMDDGKEPGMNLRAVNVWGLAEYIGSYYDRLGGNTGKNVGVLLGIITEGRGRQKRN